MAAVRMTGAVLMLAAALPTAAMAAEPTFNFLYREGTTVATFQVANPPTVLGSSTSAVDAYTIVPALRYGTLDGAGNDFGDVQLYRLPNFNETLITTTQPGNNIQIIGWGPLSQPLYQGPGTRPAIQRGRFNLTSQYDGGTPATLTISYVKNAVFTLSGTVNGSFVIGDYPDLTQYGERNGVDYFQALPISSNVTGGTIGQTTFYADGGFSAAFAGGLLSYGGFGDTPVAEPVLFSGQLFAPVFRPGTYDLGGGETLKIALPNGGPAGVPDAAVWLQLLAGFGLTGALLRAGRRNKPVPC